MKRTAYFEDLLKEINFNIEKSFENESNIGLLSGLSGILLFNSYYIKYYSKNRNSYSQDLIHLISEKINRGTVELSYCSGLAGYAWTIDHLYHTNLINIEIDGYLTEIEQILQEQMDRDFQTQKFDFLHGGLGYAFYFFKRYLHCTNDKLRRKYFHIIETSLKNLEELSIEDDLGRIKWALPTNKSTDLKIYNFGLAHGIPSILYFLSLLVDHKMFGERPKTLLEGGVKFILSNQLSGSLSIFPTALSDEGPTTPLPSRLAWCYGDLGILQILKRASKSLGNPGLELMLDSLFYRTSERKELEPNYVIDAPICHGTFGMSHIFNRLNRIDGLVTEEIANYWFDKGCELYQQSDLMNGFSIKNSQFETAKLDYGLLEGISGIGLTLISLLKNDFTWDECLMLN